MLIDDLRSSFCPYDEFLKLIDRYPYKVECKGGSRQLLAETIIITTPFHPEEVWNTNEDLEQLMGRLHSIVEVKKTK